MQQGDAQAAVVFGAARLPRALAGEQGGSLVLELSIEPRSGRILELATTIGLPGYRAVLQRLLIGRRISDAEVIASRELPAHCCGPLLKPTAAALANALANARAAGLASPQSQTHSRPAR
jgi:hypothetical protein